MAEKYRATLHGDRLEWDADSPKNSADTGVKVDVILVKKNRKPNGKKMMEALEKIAALGGVKSIPDPVKWQRERLEKTGRFPVVNNANR